VRSDECLIINYWQKNKINKIRKTPVLLKKKLLVRVGWNFRAKQEDCHSIS